MGGGVLHYSLRVSPAIPSSAATSISPVSPNSGDSSSAGSSRLAAAAATQGTVPALPVSGTANAAQVASIVAAAQAALAQTVNVSPQAQQAVKMEAFHQLIANLVHQVQSGSATLPSQWPAGGVTATLQAMVAALLQQATANQALPQQLVSLQSWPAVLTQAVLQHAGQATAGTAAGTPPAPLPALQNWLVQQGVVQAADGERAFTLTLRVPVAWAQAQAALGTALPGAATASPALASSLNGLGPLPFAGSVQQLASGALGLVMQPQTLPGMPVAMAAQAMRTSAILQLEFQPLAAAHNAQAAAAYMPAHLLPQDVQAMLQGRGTDPWLLMAQAQADGQGHKQPKNANEQAQFCNRAGCQYQGRAVCAQPFCAEMNYLWSIDRAQRR